MIELAMCIDDEGSLYVVIDNSRGGKCCQWIGSGANRLASHVDLMMMMMKKTSRRRQEEDVDDDVYSEPEG